MPEGMLHETSSLESLQKAVIKEEVLLHILPGINTYVTDVDDTNKMTEDDKYPWLYTDDKRKYERQRDN